MALVLWNWDTVCENTQITLAYAEWIIFAGINVKIDVVVNKDVVQKIHSKIQVKIHPCPTTYITDRACTGKYHRRYVDWYICLCAMSFKSNPTFWKIPSIVVWKMFPLDVAPRIRTDDNTMAYPMYVCAIRPGELVSTGVERKLSQKAKRREVVVKVRRMERMCRSGGM